MRTKAKRFWSILLSFVMIATLCPLGALATETYTGGICEHHQEHDASCGWQDAVPCSHECGDECYKEVTTEDAEGQEVKEVLNCRHEHDADCGYQEAIAPQDCQFVCEICSHAADEQEEEQKDESIDEQEEEPDEEQEDMEDEDLTNQIMLLGLGDEEEIIYVAQTADGNGSGSDESSPMAIDGDGFSKLTGDVTIKVIGKVTLPNQLPEANLVFEKVDDSSIVTTNPDTSNYKTYLNGNVVFEDVKFERAALTYLFVCGHELTFEQDVEVTGNGTFNIFGGSGKEKIETETGPVIRINTDLPGANIFGGGHGQELVGSPEIYLNDAQVSNIYAGGWVNYGADNANVTGNPRIEINNGTISGANYLFGGGYVEASNKQANVNGKTSIIADGLKFSRSCKIHGGGYVTSANSSATVDSVIMMITNSELYPSGQIFAGGEATAKAAKADVGSAEIKIINPTGYPDQVYGGGYASGGATAKVGKTDIFLEGMKTKVYGAGSGTGADVDEAVITAKNVEETQIYAGSANTSAHVLKSTEINLEGVTGTYPTSYMKIYGGSGSSADKLEDATVTVNAVSGENKVVSILNADEINIKDGAVLEQYSTSAKLFDDTYKNKDLNIAENGCLWLKNANEISGTFTAAGTLQMPKPTVFGSYFSDTVYLTANEVVVNDGAIYVPVTTTGVETGYVKGDVFVRSKTAPNQDTNEAFAVSEKGDEEGYFTRDRSVNNNGIVHEWYVDQILTATIKPLTLTKYVTPEHEHESDECFPEPRYEGIPEGAQFTVNGADWNGEGYPFTIKYYDNKGNELADDSNPGVYTAKIVPLTKDAIIGIKGYKVEFGDAKLHIRDVSDTAKNDQIEDIASDIISAIPDNPDKAVEEAVAVISGEMTYLVNNIEGQEPNPGEEIRLLHDELLHSPDGGNEYMNALAARLVDGDDPLVTPDENRQYAMKYLDLIDANDSNLLVCAQGEYDIYLPYPKGTDMKTDFQLFRFDDLNRTYTEADNNDNAMNNIKDTPVSEVKVENTKYGIKFTVPVEWAENDKNYSIGAMALTWIQQPTAQVTFLPGDHGTLTGDDKVTVDKGSQLTADLIPGTKADNGWKFDGWMDENGKTYPSLVDVEITDDIIFTAQWTKEGGGSSGGGGGHSSGGKKNTIKREDGEKVLTDEHFAYIVGYEDGKVRPMANITRSEVAVIYFRLLDADYREKYLTSVNAFPDVKEGDWFNTAVSTLANAGIIAGRDDGKFHPNDPITRAELATIVSKFADLKEGENRFVDVSGHWAESFINSAATYGWISGYPDSTFRPDRYITRAEVMTLTNNVLERAVQKDGMHEDMRTWIDNVEGQWYYETVQEATNSHDYNRNGKKVSNVDFEYETWTDINPDPDWSSYSH